MWYFIESFHKVEMWYTTSIDPPLSKIFVHWSRTLNSCIVVPSTASSNEAELFAGNNTLFVSKHAKVIYDLFPYNGFYPSWRHQMEIFSALLALLARNSPVTGEFPSQRPVTQSFDVFFDLCLNKQLSKQSWGWWFGTPSRPLWRHCNACFCPSDVITQGLT